ncbi:pyruvate kinase, partial [Helicosporidium sp. ATCC 50920]
MDTRNVAKAKTHFFTDVDISDVLVPIEAAAGRCQWGTKIAVTLGPACQSTDTLVELLESGMTCARIDVTWGTLEYHQRSLSNLAAAMRRAQRLCSVWLDTTGREVAVRQAVTLDENGWPKLGAPLEIKRGSCVTLTANPTAQVSPSLLPITAPSLALHVSPGTLVEVGRYLGTGATGATLRLRVQSVTRDQEVVCQALHDASLDGLLTVMAHHSPDSHDAAWDLDLPILTEADVAALRSLGAEYEIDYVSASFVSCAADVADVRGVLDALGLHQTKIVAKVERRPGIRHFEAIAAAADAILLSRGNLGLDYDAELMAILQKHVVGLCNALGKPIFLTRFVDTMVSAPRPTRAEATDVANAVLDGVDGILLGAETQSGANARLTVKTIAQLARCAERHFDYRSHHDRLADD